ncbi:MAG: GNAT family N-acetyltransferase [Clostridia bacterium]|nr:GNAT family N-acetyltransferase [Clostridia bacterium]
MPITFKEYEDKDYLRIRDFIIKTYAKLKTPNTWLLDRWEFVEYYQEVHHKTVEQWHEKIGIWEYADGSIAAVACTDWDAFFLLDTLEPSEALMDELIGYAETKQLQYENGISKNCLTIRSDMQALETCAIKHGYVPTEWSETIVSMSLDRPLEVVIPNGFQLKWGNEVDAQRKALGHIMAFNYPGTDHATRALECYGNIQKAPDYNPVLDLCLVNEAGDVVAFTTVWFDTFNKIGVFEPVGTHKDYRNQGLAKAVIYEGANRMRRLGGVKAYVGADQPFYRKIGFTPDTILKKWQKKL